MKTIGILVGAAAGLVATSMAAHAFCGFYVAGSNQKMFNDATQVVLMRQGTRTVLSMQNDYRGPLEDFALVVPVPVILKATDVKVLDKGLFERIDSLGSPRLVEYWEQDPCPLPPPEMQIGRMDYAMGVASGDAGGVALAAPPMPAPPPPPRKATEPSRPVIPPVLASFTASMTSITANEATPIVWSYRFSNSPWPAPSCTIDHGVGYVSSGARVNVTLTETSTVTLTCENSGGASTKQVKISAIKIENKFDVAEYQILILAATEAAGLQEWLKNNGYKIPDGAEPLLRPYIESGSKFFVAKVNGKKVKMVDGRAALSPLRFHYDSDEFSLPIRLGLANSSGKQDLIVNILSADKRYEVANYKNVFIPTNFDVWPLVKTRFAEFYAGLFDKTIEANPRAVVTEYAWTAVPNYHCDPCTDADLSNPDITALGADVIGGQLAAGTFVLTRLHARYGKADMKDDLRFKEATPVTGGREQWSKQGIEYGAVPSAQNYFQARYAIRHWWTGPIKCANPQRHVWGGPPDGNYQPTIGATKTAFAPRGRLEIATVVSRDLWEINLKHIPPSASPAPAPGPGGAPVKPKAMGLVFVGGGGAGAVALLAIVLLLRRRRRG